MMTGITGSVLEDRPEASERFFISFHFFGASNFQVKFLISFCSSPWGGGEIFLSHAPFPSPRPPNSLILHTDKLISMKMAPKRELIDPLGWNHLICIRQQPPGHVITARPRDGSHQPMTGCVWQWWRTRGRPGRGGCGCGRPITLKLTTSGTKLQLCRLKNWLAFGFVSNLAPV